MKKDPGHFRWRFAFVAVALILLNSLCDRFATCDEIHDEGRKVYEAKCAACHGLNGEGVKDKHDEQLIGDLPVSKLAELITKTMPEENAKDCVGAEAEKVAAYIYDSFYSPEARARRVQSRIKLSRLTKRQYNLATTDLFAIYTGNRSPSHERGLKAEYFDSRNHESSKRKINRIDPVVDFDFGEGSPDDKLKPKEFAIAWHGSLIADDSGVHEIIVNTPNGMRLWLNDSKEALIDAWVASPGDHSAKIRLIGGRQYQIRIEFFKFKESKASISLEWKPPFAAREVIPNRNLTPDRAGKLTVVQTPFPPDDSSEGYERGTTISKSWERATTWAAVEIAESAISDIDQLSRSRPDSSDRKLKIKQFVRRFAERAFRRPLTDDEHQLYIDSQFEIAEDLSAVKRSLLLILKSPQFLYLGLNQQPDPFDIASQISFAMYDSIPDEELWYAAKGDRLKSKHDVRSHCERLLNDPRMRSKLRYFFHKWLDMDHAEQQSKDKATFPDFDKQIVNDLRTSLDHFIEKKVWGENGSLPDLLTSDQVYLNQRLASYYGVEIPNDHAFHAVELNKEFRAGLLTHPYLLVDLAYDKESSPIHRGVFLARSLLGRTLKPPPVAVSPEPETEQTRDLTTREKIEQQTQEAACQACHGMINSLGFTLEHFDAVGRFREKEKTKPIDVASIYTTREGKDVALSGAVELADFLAHSPDVHRSFISQLFNHFIKQPPAAYGPETLENLRLKFVESNFNIRKLIVEIVVAGTRIE